MLEESVLELINKQLDGEASAEEAAQLREILAQNSEARTMAEDLRALARELASVNRAVPPPTLQPAVLRSLAALQDGARVGGLGASLRNFTRAAWNWKPSFVFAGGAAAGLLLCVVGWWLISPGSVDERDLVGSLAFRGTLFPAASVREFTEGPLRASIASARRDGEAIVRIHLDVPPGTVVSFLYNGKEASIKAIDVPPGAQGEILLEEGEIIVKGVATGQVGVLFGGKGEILAGMRVRLADGHGGEWVLPVEETPAR
jgi:hypothetical protein